MQNVSSPVRKARRGFTLLEILIAVAIVGMLVGLAVTNTDKILGQSQEGVAKLFVNESLKTSLVRYRIDMGDFPSTEEGIKDIVAGNQNRIVGEKSGVVISNATSPRKKVT